MQAARRAAALARLRPCLLSAECLFSTAASLELTQQPTAAPQPLATSAVGSAPKSFYKRPLPRDLIPFASAEGKRIFASALEDGSLEGFFPLVQHFQTQSEPASCALGTLCMVLNALGVDPGLSWKGPWRWWSEEVLLGHWDAAVQALPPPQRRALADVRSDGMSLAEFSALSSASGLHTTVRHAEDASSDAAGLAAFQEAVWQALGCGSGCDGDHAAHGGRGGTHVVVSFNRSRLAQTGDGHFSPLGGYSRRHAAVLVMDVARFKYPPYWVPIAALWEAMQPVDRSTGRSRGYVVLKGAAIPRDSDRCPVGVDLLTTKARHAERRAVAPEVLARLRAHAASCTDKCGHT